MVALSDIDTLEEFPPVKIGALMHAAGLVEEESQEGRFVPPWQLHSGPEEEPETPMQRQLRVIKEQMLAEFSSATTDPTVVSELRSPLYFCGDVVAEAGRRIRVLGPLGEGFRVEVLGVGEFIVSREELCDAGPLPIQVQATA